MQRSLGVCLVWFLMVGALPAITQAQNVEYDRQEDVVYGRKHGMALTLDVFTPKDKANGVGVIYVVSGGWFSAHQAINPGFIQPFLNRGYTVFAVVHGSQPRFTIPDVLEDMHRSVRFIRHNAERFKIDPERIGIYGGSAGGHLSLMQGTSGNAGNPNSPDPIERVSSRVQAVACFFPPTDFLNYGKEGENAVGVGVLKDFKAPFDFQVFSPQTRLYERVTDENVRNEVGRQISPVTHVTADDPPTLIVHGDADLLVPIQQAQLIIDKLKAVEVPVELITKPGAAHGWKDIHLDLETFADWCDKHLVAQPTEPKAKE